MNPQQFSEQIVWSIGAIVSGTPNLAWPETPFEAVLGKAMAGVEIPADFFSQDAVAPFAFVHIDATQDNEEVPPDVIEEQRFTIYMFAMNATDMAGGAAVVGGNRESLGSSKSRGLAEVEPLVKGQLFRMLSLVGRARTRSAQPIALAGKMAGLIAQRALDVIVTRMPGYPDYTPVDKLLATASGGGAVALSWAAAPSRYDIVGYTWARAAGSTAPTSPVGGTFVASTNPSLSDAPGAGTFSYAIFWAFDATKDPLTGTGDINKATGAPIPNRWSSSQTAQNGVLYLPASVTVVAT